MNLLAICAITIIINNSGFEWNSYDQETLERAKTRCGYYFKNSPCLSKLEKKGERRYYATCSKEQK